MKAGFKKMETENKKPPCETDKKQNQQASVTNFESSKQMNSQQTQNKNETAPTTKTVNEQKTEIRLSTGNNNTHEKTGIVEKKETGTKTVIKDERVILAEITPVKNSFSSEKLDQSDKEKSGTAYFTYILNENINRIQAMCTEWKIYKDEQSPSDEACDMINVAIGQSQLLISKKFEQFRDLINKCENKNFDAPVTCEDLHGFWDMIYIQVVNLDKRFESLKQLKANGWQEVIPENKSKVKTKAIVKRRTVKSDSSLKDIIKAARDLKKKQKNSQETITFDAIAFSVVSPARCKAEERMPPENSAKKRILGELGRSNTSPGLKVLKASIHVKQATEGDAIGEMDENDCIDSNTSNANPRRRIRRLSK